MSGRFPCMLASALTLFACAGDDADSQTRPSGGAATGDDRCPMDTPMFAASPDSGLLVMGKRNTLRARIIRAQPAQPERFENDWTIRLTDANGMPIVGAELVDVCTFMPVHGHGGAPQEVGETEPATFVLTGLNLFMRGPWEVQIATKTGAAGAAIQDTTSCDRERRRPGSDLLRFQVCVPDD